MTNNIGSLGEDLVAYWLQTQGWSILQRRWYCRWGELDLVAQQSLSQSPHTGECKAQDTLAFIEVKTRSQGNWDENGLLAVTPRKQAKIGKAARLFLARYPVLADSPCRFDVALVCYRQLPISSMPSLKSFSKEALQLQMPVSLSIGQSVRLADYQLTLLTYLESAFYVEFS